MADRRFALALFAAALVAGVTGPMVLPQGLIWITVGVLFWAAGTIWYRTIDWSVPPDDAIVGATVLLKVTPDLPQAEAICSRLRDNGIEAFWIGPEEDASAQVWIAEGDLVEAQALLEQVSDSTP